MKKVLIVDDEPRILKFLSLKLSTSGFQVIPAANGNEALEQTKKSSPDIIIMDIIMPGMDGVETLKCMRQMCKCPIILFSARDHDSEEIRKLGADDYLRKPFDPDELVSRINLLLDNHKG